MKNQNMVVQILSLNSQMASTNAGAIPIIVKIAIARQRTPMVVKVADNPFIFSTSYIYNS